MRSPVTTMAAFSIGALPSPVMTRAPSNTVTAPGVWPRTGAVLAASKNTATAPRQHRIQIGPHILISSLGGSCLPTSPVSSSAKADDPVTTAFPMENIRPVVTGCSAFAEHDTLGGIRHPAYLCKPALRHLFQHVARNGSGDQRL